MNKFSSILTSIVNRENIFVVLAYVLLGRLGLYLAVPPGYASAIFPSAGVALASLLILGPRSLPAIFLGSFTLNLWIGYEAGSDFTSSLPYILAVVIAIGSSLQAKAARRFLRKVLPSPLRLISPKELFLFFVVAGPFSCLISASVGVTALWLGGVVSESHLFLSWWNWWVGDAIGSMVVTPLILTFFGEPRGLWRSRVQTVFIPTVIAMAIAISFFVSANRWEERRIAETFAGLTESITDDILKRTRASVDILPNFLSLSQAIS